MFKMHVSLSVGFMFLRSAVRSLTTLAADLCVLISASCHSIESLSNDHDPVSADIWVPV